MEHVSASHAKQNFGEVIARAAQGPVGVERHRKLIAVVVPARWLQAHPALDERRAARDAQQRVEQARLSHHQRVGIELLCADAAGQARRLNAARKEVDRWEGGQLCSADYIARWREWLALPVRRLVPRMCSQASGWGPAMRQNSPFGALAHA